jgi:hypothetical protein
MNKCRIGSKFLLSSSPRMDNVLRCLGRNGSCCALCSGGRGEGGVLTGGRGRPAREDKSEDARGGAMGMAIAQLIRCAAVDAAALLLLLSPWTLNGLATKLGIIGERSGEVSQRPGRLLTERRKGEVLSVQSGARLSVLQRCAEERLGGEKIEEGRRESNGGGGGLGELRVGFKMVGRSGVERWVAGGGGDAHVARGSDREGASRWAHSAWASCWRP